MMNKYCYYIFKDVYMGEKIKLPFHMKIWKYSTSKPFLHFEDYRCNGPYASLELLELHSPIIQQLKMKYEKNEWRVLFEGRNISELVDMPLFPKNRSYPIDLVNIITHGLKGDTNRDISTGGHFLDQNKVRITQMLGTNNKGVIKAKIEIYDYKKEKWLPKRAITTLFPESWSLQKYINECRHCYDHKIQISNEMYKAYTKCGIETRIVVENGKSITFYPIFE